MNFRLADDVVAELNELQLKGIDVNEILRAALNSRRMGIARKKEGIVEENVGETKPVSRYIPAKIRQIIREEHGAKCSYPSCFRPSTTLHHTQRFALTKSHNPEFIAPLCAAHHEIAHKVDVRFVGKLISQLKHLI